MKINKMGIHITYYQQYKLRYCCQCNTEYRIIDISYLNENKLLEPPINYYQGCEEFCYKCWVLGEDSLEIEKIKIHKNLKIEYPNSHEYWYDENNYEKIDLGDIHIAFKEYMRNGFHLIVLPISRIATNKSIFLPYGIMIYPENRVDISKYNPSFFQKDEIYPHPNELTINQLSILQTHLSGVSIDDLNNYPCIVMPIKFDWDILLELTHEKQLEMIYQVSEKINTLSLNFLRYKFCTLKYSSTEQLPSNASQTLINNMSASLLIKNDITDSKFIAGDVFSHQITKGLGLGIRQLEWIDFPCLKGDMGKLVNHALSLYVKILETQSATSKFVQILSLLEFLVFPDEYKRFKDVKKKIARYITTNTNSIEYKNILDRFEELTGKRDNETKEILGYRTKIVHMGSTIEDILPTYQDRNSLFIELDIYIRNIIDDMINKSLMSKEEYYK